MVSEGVFVNLGSLGEFVPTPIMLSISFVLIFVVCFLSILVAVNRNQAGKERAPGGHAVHGRKQLFRPPGANRRPCRRGRNRVIESASTKKKKTNHLVYNQNFYWGHREFGSLAIYPLRILKKSSSANLGLGAGAGGFARIGRGVVALKPVVSMSVAGLGTGGTAASVLDPSRAPLLGGR